MGVLSNISEVYNTSAWNITDLAAVELFNNYPEGLLRFAAICSILFMVIGIPGNTITIIALARYKKVHNATAMFIMNLSCSDLLFCCFNLPLAASTFWRHAWVHGHTLCRLFPLARYTLVAVSLLTVLAITINRYVMISHPRLYPKIYKGRNIAVMIALIWIASFGTLLTTWFEKWGRFGLDTTIGSCSILPDEKNRSPKTFLFLGAFILPGLAIMVCYARIFFIVRKSTKKTLQNKISKIPQETTCDSESSSSRLVASVSVKEPAQNVTSSDANYLESPSSSSTGLGSERTITFKPSDGDNNASIQVDERSKGSSGLRRTALRKSMALLKMSLPTRKDRKLGTMIMAIMICFCVCHLPITITKVIREITPNPILNITAYILLYLSSCINPVTYVVMSKDYRKAYKNLFRCRQRGKIPIKNNNC